VTQAKRGFCLQKSMKNLNIICFSGTDWWYHNRGLFCPQVMRRLAKERKVLYVNSLGMRLPSLKKDRHAVKKILRKLVSMSRFLKKVENRMYVFSPLSIPLLGSCLGRRLSAFLVGLQVKLAAILLGLKEPIVYIGCPTALGVIKKLKKKYVIYERSDLYEEMPGTNKLYIAHLDDELTRLADLVLYMNKRFWSDGVSKNANSLLIGHGVDFDLFVNAENYGRIPEDIARVPRPIIGWFGDMSDKTSDIALLAYAVKKLPDLSFVCVGPISTDVSRLRQCANVYFLGPKPYEQVPFYGKEFDVVIMPWNRNKWMNYSSPVKTKEYLALGKPIVSIDYPELELYHDVVYVSLDYDQFVGNIRKGIKENDPHLKIRRREKVRNETWDNKVKVIMDFIEQKLEQPEND
jgi:glycosyltransferase involved in cell wall biosynthesis